MCARSGENEQAEEIKLLNTLQAASCTHVHVRARYKQMRLRFCFLRILSGKGFLSWIFLVKRCDCVGFQI